MAASPEFFFFFFYSDRAASKQSVASARAEAKREDFSGDPASGQLLRFDVGEGGGSIIHPAANTCAFLPPDGGGGEDCSLAVVYLAVA